jgi:hypothetical protein
MQPGVLRFLLFRLRPAPFSLVLAGLALAALVPVSPAIAGEVAADVPPVPWHHVLPDDGEAGFLQSPAGFRGLTGLEPVLREADDGVPWRGLFFHAGDGLRIGAQGSFDPGSGNLRAMVALKLDF